MKHLGWILDLYHKPGLMVVWLKKPDGGCVRLTDSWRPRIHVGGDYRELVDLACETYIGKCRFVEKFEKPGDREMSRVLEVETDSDSKAAQLARRIQRESNYKFRLYDVDIPSSQVYLYKKGLFPLALVEAEDKDRQVDWSLKDSRQIIDYRLPPLRKVELQVKTRKNRRVRTFEDELDSIQVITDEKEPIILDCEGETGKILGLVETFRETDPDIVTTDGGDSFIFPYLARRAHARGMLDQLVLGRDPSPLRVYEVQGHSYFSYGKILYRDTAARLLGRLHIDQRNAFISADCGLEGLFEISRTCIVPVQRASRATIGTNMTSLQLYHAVKQDVLIPWNKNQPEEWKDGNQLVVADRGGYIYEPQPGIFDRVGEIDFTSLYPTIMLKKNLSGETVKCTCCPDSAQRVPELDYNICDRWRGIASQSLEILLKRRREYKKRKKTARDEHLSHTYDARQSALKWILVCSFGYLGFKNARFGKIDAHIATCAFARNILRQAAALAEAQGFKLVHAIVDSMWMTKPEATDADYEKLSALISRELDFPLSFEGQYKWIVFLNSKIDHGVMVLNRYYGVLQDGTFRVRGIDLRRHDTPGIVNDCQGEMLRVLWKADNSREFEALIPRALDVLEKYASRLRAGHVPIEELVISKSLSKNPEEYTHQVPQATAARRFMGEGGKVHAGQQISYLLTRNVPETSQVKALTSELADESTSYDPEKYVDLLISSAANLLLPLGYNVKSLKSLII